MTAPKMRPLRQTVGWRITPAGLAALAAWPTNRIRTEPRTDGRTWWPRAVQGCQRAGEVTR